jgi:hypothetical protein
MLTEHGFKPEKVIGKYAFNCYNAVGLFMATLHLDCLVEHLKVNMTFLVLGESASVH